VDLVDEEDVARRKVREGGPDVAGLLEDGPDVTRSASPSRARRCGRASSAETGGPDRKDVVERLRRLEAAWMKTRASFLRLSDEVGEGARPSVASPSGSSVWRTPERKSARPSAPIIGPGTERGLQDRVQVVHRYPSRGAGRRPRPARLVAEVLTRQSVVHDGDPRSLHGSRRSRSPPSLLQLHAEPLASLLRPRNDERSARSAPRSPRRARGAAGGEDRERHFRAMRRRRRGSRRRALLLRDETEELEGVSRTCMWMKSVRLVPGPGAP